MKRIFFAVILSMLSLLTPHESGAQTEEPTIYVVRKGDTLWGLSDKFLKDPFYWPNLWARNQKITNPHLIFPGQRLRIYPDRIEIEEPAGPAPEQPLSALPPAVDERAFIVTGAEGYLLDNLNPVGSIIQTNHERLYVGQEDMVYTDIGTATGAKPGDRFSIFKKMKAVKHPVTGEFMGYKYLSMGSLALTDMQEQSSRAVITKSYMEIGPGMSLLPYRDRRKIITLKAATRDLEGCIISARLDNISIGQEDVVYLDLGKSQGVEIGNYLYVVRDVAPNPKYVTREVGDLPLKVIGALVVVDVGERTSSALVVKSAEEIFPGEKVLLLKH